MTRVLAMTFCLVVGACQDGGARRGASDAPAGTSRDADAETTTGEVAEVADTPDVYPSQVAFEDWCDQAEGARQALADACWGADRYYGQGWQLAEASAVCRGARAAVDAGRLAYDEAKAATCLAVAWERRCEDNDDPFVDPACAAVFHGTVPLGGACDNALPAVLGPGAHVSACREGACFSTTGTCPATCQPYPAIGEPCGAANDAVAIPCDPAVAYCENGRCRVFQAIGETCPLEFCGPDAVCAEAGDRSQCTPVAADGAPCSENAACRSPWFVCLAGQCRFHVGLGDPCKFDAQCPPELTCAPSASSDGTCVTRSAAGEWCNHDRNCADGLRCGVVSDGPGTCAPTLPDGAPCGQLSECGPTSFCTFDGQAATCQPLAGEGGSCRAPPGAYAWTACQAPLMCLSDNRCHRPGGLGELCEARVSQSCRWDLACGLDTLVCEPRAALGGACNPYVAHPCEGGLACRCASENRLCNDLGQPEHGTFACAAPLVDQAPCWASSDCASGACERCAADGPCVDYDQPGACQVRAPACHPE